MGDGSASAAGTAPANPYRHRTLAPSEAQEALEAQRAAAGGISDYLDANRHVRRNSGFTETSSDSDSAGYDYYQDCNDEFGEEFASYEAEDYVGTHHADATAAYYAQYGAAAAVDESMGTDAVQYPDYAAQYGYDPSYYAADGSADATAAYYGADGTADATAAYYAAGVPAAAAAAVASPDSEDEDMRPVAGRRGARGKLRNPANSVPQSRSEDFGASEDDMESSAVEIDGDVFHDAQDEYL